MKARLIVLSSILWLAAGAAFGQQDKLITHFMYDKMSLNPGSTGMNDGICGTMIYRNQWDKVNGAPNSAVFNAEANLNRFRLGGAGISFYHDAIGFTRQNNLLLNYSHPFEIKNVGRLGVGVGVGITNVGMNPNWVPPTSAVDPSLPVGWGATNFDLNLGLYLKGYNDFYVGLSSTHLSASTLSASTTPVTTYNTARHYYLMGGKKFAVTSTGDVEANVLLRSDLVKVSSDINVRYIWKNMAYGGLTYRTSDAIAVMLGADILELMGNVTKQTSNDHFLVGYSYDITINRLSSISRGTHEMFVKYCYYLPPIPIAKSKHPRWL